MRFSSLIQALASLSSLVSVVSAAGAHIKDCDGSNNGYFPGGKGCTKWDHTTFEVIKLGKQCAGKFLSLAKEF